MIRKLCNPLSHQTLSLTLTLTRPNPVFSLFTTPRLHSLSPTAAVAKLVRQRPLHKMSINNLHSVPIPDIDKASKPELIRALESSIGSPFSTEPIQPSRPLIVVISGPSGVGKDAVINKLRESRSNLHFVVTATSRPMRPGEVNGKDYIFVSKEEFLQLVEMNELLEYALVYGDYKGIPKKQITEFRSKGFDIVLRVDIQGARTLRRVLGDSAVFVFVVAGSEMEMVERLIDRKTESKDELLVRIATAREEVKHIKNFDYVVVNSQGKLDEAARLLESIIDAEKARAIQRNVTF